MASREELQSIVDTLESLDAKVRALPELPGTMRVTLAQLQLSLVDAKFWLSHMMDTGRSDG